MISDKKIWSDSQKSQVSLLSDIYHQHIQLLYRYGKKFSQDEELIKDTIHDLFFDLMKAQNNLEKADNIKFYLMASFRRKLKRNLSKQNTSFDAYVEHDLEANIVYPVEQDLIGQEELSHKEKMVRKALQMISPKQREILFYRFTCDFEYDQICEIMSLKYDSARKQVFRALKTLKQYLPENDIILIYFNYKKK